MAKVNVLHEVSSDLKMEYQSGNIDEIQINTAENGKIMVKQYELYIIRAHLNKRMFLIFSISQAFRNCLIIYGII